MIGLVIRSQPPAETNHAPLVDDISDEAEEDFVHSSAPNKHAKVVSSNAIHPEPGEHKQEHVHSYKHDLIKVLRLADPADPKPLWSWVPMPLVAVCHQQRLEQLLLACGNESKSNLINEISTHILVDCLFITITSAPIYTDTLQHSNAIHTAVIFLFYFTFQIQLMSILLQGMSIFAIMEVPTDKFADWAVTRVQVFLFCSRLHIFGMYCFLACSLSWPFTVFSLPLAFSCLGVQAIPWLVGVGVVGSTYHVGAFGVLNPHLRLSLFPTSQELRKRAQADMELFCGSTPSFSATPAMHSHGHGGHEGMGRGRVTVMPIADTTALTSFLAKLNLSHLVGKLIQQQITDVDLLAALENEDYRHMNISIGERMRIKKALASL